jgi:hypothetical protein
MRCHERHTVEAIGPTKVFHRGPAMPETSHLFFSWLDIHRSHELAFLPEVFWSSPNAFPFQVQFTY